MQELQAPSFSILFSSSNGRHSRSFTIQQRTFYLILALFMVLVSVLVYGIYNTLNNPIQKRKLVQVESAYSAQQHALNDIESSLDDLSQNLNDILEMEAEIRLILGDTKVPYLPKRSKKKRQKKIRQQQASLQSTFSELMGAKATQVSRLGDTISYLKDVAQLKQKSVAILLDKTRDFKHRFASTPSIKPLYGRVLSKYGWRYHPLYRRRKFHKGIDITSWTGAPIQATADGLVEFAGWSSSFGYVVVLDHNYGYRTIYAHCSQLLCKKGEMVKKGQIIAQVGSTGLSTGPHLHYEVKKWRKSLRPNAYMDLDMFTAITKIW